MGDPVNSDQLHLDDWQLLAHLSQVFRNVSDSFADQVGIPRGQGGALCVVAEQDGMTQSEIAERLLVQGATITVMLQSLEKAGLVNRRRDSEDNRLVRIYITETGRQKEQAVRAQWSVMQELAYKGLSPEERALLRRWLQRIIGNMSDSG